MSTVPNRRRPAREPLTRERIVDAALALVEADGLAGFSTRKLGERLGCEAMSIYHHFPSKQHLLDALVEHAIASVDVPEPGPDGEARLRRLLESYRAMAHRWPKLFPLVALHRLNMPAGIRFIESVVSVIDAKMQDPELTARHFRAMGYFLIGACLEETAGYAKGPSAAEPVDDDFVAREAPHLTRVARYFAPSEWQQTWQLGVDALIVRGNADAAAAAAKRPRPRREAPRRRAAKRNP
nr:TetR/AcrR family transcriptional regulator [Caldimonas sp.]